ncbi:MAG: glycosyltransferase family 4 protein [Pseudomonadota bacterium]
MHILILALEFPPLAFGGAGTYLAQLADGLAAEDVRLTIAVGGWGSRESVVEANRHVHFLHPDIDPLALGSEFFGLLSEGAAKEIVFRCESAWGIPDVIHCNNWFTYRCGEILRARWGVPLVSTVHSLEHLFTPRWGVDTQEHVALQEREMCRSSDLLIAVSASVEDDIRRVCADATVAVVHNGAAPWPAPDPDADSALDALLSGGATDDATEDGARSDASAAVARGAKKLVVFAGRLVPQKGLRFLLHAFREIGAARDDLLLVVAGDGIESHTYALRTFAERDPVLAANTRFVGRLDRPQLQALYARAAMAIVPSLYEPFGYAATEAMAAGVPVIASRMGGLAEIIEHDRSGILVEVSIDAQGHARIDPHALAAAIVALADDEAAAQRCREGGLARAADFTQTRMAALTLQAYRRALGSA